MEKKDLEIAQFILFKEYPVAQTFYIIPDFPGLVAGNEHAHGVPEAIAQQCNAALLSFKDTIKQYGGTITTHSKRGFYTVSFQQNVSFDLIDRIIQKSKMPGITYPPELRALRPDENDASIRKELKGQTKQWQKKEEIWTKLNPKFNEAIIKKKLRNSIPIEVEPESKKSGWFARWFS